MVGLWVLLAGLVILGSLMWLLPSPAERRRMAMRQRAIQQGLKVRRLFSQDLPQQAAGGREVYYLYYQPVANDMDERIREEWSGVGKPSVPGSVFWLEWGPGYAGVVWNEQPATEAAARQVCTKVLSLTPRPPAPPAMHSCG